MTSLDIFCDVIDNYGDAGVCLHLSRTMSHKGFKVRLFCNNMAVLQRICNESDYQNPQLSFVNWEQPLSSYDPAQCVINAFGCRFDTVTHAALIAKPTTLIIHLEYLSAETWVEDCHGLPSFVDGLTTHYFFPGFTSRTGGLNIDKTLTDKCLPRLQQIHAKLHASAATAKAASSSTSSTFASSANSTSTSAAATDAANNRVISLFGYENKAVGKIVESLETGSKRSIIRVFEGLCLDNINALMGWKLEVGQQAEVGSALTIEAVPMVGHDAYDEILINSDFNLVRGEDSIVRAMHTGNPFLWQIYPQDEEAHTIKLQSFLDRMRTICSEEIPALIATEQHVASTAAGDAAADATAATASVADAAARAAGASFIAVDKAASDAMLDEISKVMLAYNGSGSWPEDFDFGAFEQRTAVAFYNLAVYLNHRINLSESLCTFIDSKLQR